MKTFTFQCISEDFEFSVRFTLLNFLTMYMYYFFLFCLLSKKLWAMVL